jgi:signal transduction histidine kinase
LLERQVKRYLGDSDKLPAQLTAFVAAVDAAYTSADADRSMIERTLALMSKELTEANAGLRNELAERQRTELALQKEKEEQRVLIAKLEDVHNQLLQSEKMASIGQLAAGVAHEINNPIGFVYSNLGTLEKYVEDTFRMLSLYEQAEAEIANPDVLAGLQAAKQDLDISYLKSDLHALMKESKDGIVRVKVIVQNLKDFSHVGASDEWRYSDLQQGLESTLNIVNNEIKYKADVVREYGAIPEVECILSQLNQVFMNLLVNAAYAISERGTITIRTGCEGNEVWVEISDTGQGIPPENLQKIIDPFFTTKPVGKGTGLGLSLSYGILQKHHGRLEVNSELGRGTTFRISLPVIQPK